MPKKKQVVFPELEANIACQGIKKSEIAACLSIQPRTLTFKLNGRHSFSLEEAIKIKQTWFPDIPIEELFKHN